ncbi:hypothetical protein GF380_02400 [Candidatus Uhrbacteria bacterium]|nr:hypothetical protein [Candidatus Uhrbacteria bacterium]
MLTLLEQIDPKRTCVNVISKSGGTLETMSSFLVFRELLKKRCGKTFGTRIIATTDSEQGALHDLAQKEGYHTLNVPSNVGGRYSVLSAVGLFPALVMDVDIQAMQTGASSLVRTYIDHKDPGILCGAYAGMHVIGLEKGKQIHVLMTYVRRLDEFTKWVRQLVAESLGKRVNRRGRVIHTGPTPVASVGPEDQHSQLQLYSEGPFDKLITFINQETHRKDLKTPAVKSLPSPINTFGGKSFAKMLQLERAATAESLRLNGRPNGTIHLQKLDAAALGELFQFFEITVGLMGELMDVNAYDQPGVELSKQLMRKGM